jgi:hypothetical protein
MTTREMLNLQEENAILRKALEDTINFHHLIGNDDCPFTTNQIMVTLYKTAERGLADADNVNKVVAINPLDTSGLFDNIKNICQDYNSKITKQD